METSIMCNSKLLYCKGHPDVRHVASKGAGCGGEVAVGGAGTLALPLGFGFDSSDEKNRGHFVVDRAVYKTYSGFCMKCGASGTFVRRDQRPKVERKRTGHKVRMAS